MRKILSVVVFFHLLFGQEVILSSNTANLALWGNLDDGFDDSRLNYAIEESLEKLNNKKGIIGSSNFENISELHQSVVYIIAENKPKNEISRGAGVVINEEGDILTAHHIIKDKTKIQVIYYSKGDENKFVSEIREKIVSAELIKASKTKDLALLSTKNNKQKYFPIKFGYNISVKQGVEVISSGHPNDWIYFYSRGVIQKVLNQFSKHPELPRLNANVIFVGFDGTPGASGSPLLNRKGEMLGLIFSDAKNLNDLVLAIKIDEIKRFIEN